MRRVFLVAMMLVSAVLSPLRAAVVHSYSEALSKAGDKPIVIFLYGANYDKLSMKTYDEFIKKNKILPAVRKSVFLVVPVYQNPTPDEKKKYAKIMGDKKLPGGIWSYPCLAVVDSHGKLRGIVQSAQEMKSVESATAALKPMLDAFEQQEKLLSKAERASGARKADLILQASNINLTLPDGVGKEKNNKRRGRGEMDDDIGLKNRMSFDPIAVVEKLQIMSFEEADAYIRGMIAEGCYSRRQRQEMMAAYAGHLRRNGASAERLRALYTEMRNLDPNSMYGAYAEGAIALWVEKKAFDPSTVPVEVRRASEEVTTVAAVPGTVEPDPEPTVRPSGSSGGMTALGSTSLEDVAGPSVEDEPSEDDFEADADAEAEAE
ncbi:MAG: hypothetical protein IJE66_02275 [Akkermansia sp.]|nr:hypothetical protein [Akkermansia sp.]